MPSKTLGDRVLDLENLGAFLTSGLDFTSKSTEKIGAEHKTTISILHDCRVRYDRDIALLQREIDELKTRLAEQKDERSKEKEEQKKERDELARRRWAFGPNIAAAVISVVLGPLISALVAYVVSRP
jgi:hypothetical protein